MPQSRNKRDTTERRRASSEAAENGVAMAAVPNGGGANVNGNTGGKIQPIAAAGVMEEITDGCCCPTGCQVGEPIDPNDLDDAVPVICSNPDCDAGQFMHRICFDAWEESVMAHVRICGRARNWSEKQMVQNLWTKKGFDVAYKACGCKCGHGHLRKDLDAAAMKPVFQQQQQQQQQQQAADEDARRRRNRRKSGSKQVPIAINGNGVGMAMGGSRMRSRTLSLGSAAGLYLPSSSPPNQLAHSLGAVPKKSTSNLDFFSDVQVQNTGSIFQRRETMASFYELLPSWKVNGIHIKMEDDCPQGNDETRIFVLTSLGDHKMRSVPCVLCRTQLTVFDKYPLVDGTFFMSPVNHGDVGVKVRHDSREGYLFAICIFCLEHSNQFGCTRCGTDKWFMGDRLVLGTLYTYDVLASVPCCPPTCRNCRKQLPLPQAHNFSAYSEPFVCPNCGRTDLHYIRQLESVKRADIAASA